MDYVIADKTKARSFGFTETGHIVKGNLICLNEKEVMCSHAFNGTLEERAALICGCVASHSEAKMIMSNSK